MGSVEPFDGVTALAQGSLVTARSIIIVEICAPGTLQQVSPHRRHVSYLPRGPGQNGAGKQRVARTYSPMFGHRCVFGSRSYQDAAVFPLGHGTGKAGDVDQRGRPLKSLPHQISEIGTSAEVFCMHFAAKPDCVSNVGRAGISKTIHFVVSANSAIASTIP